MLKEQKNSDQKIFIISGATASGKSALALEIALQKNGVVINADAMQSYQELPILSAQPSNADQTLVSHFLYSVLKHSDDSSVAIWLELVQTQINLAFENGKLPIVVGGTGLYLSKLIDGINKVPQTDADLKAQIRQMVNEISKEELIEILLDLGEDQLVKELDKQRLCRRLEVLKSTGKSLSFWQSQPNQIFYPKEYFHHINVELPRDILYQNCNQRLALMFENGAVEEVKSLLKQGLDENSLITKTIGFLEIKDYLQGNISKEKAIEIASQKTRNYAKRQLTWFRNQFNK